MGLKNITPVASSLIHARMRHRQPVHVPGRRKMATGLGGACRSRSGPGVAVYGNFNGKAVRNLPGT